MSDKLGMTDEELAQRQKAIAAVRDSLSKPSPTPSECEAMEKLRLVLERLARSIHVDGLVGMVGWRKDPEMADMAEPFFEVFNTYRDVIALIASQRQEIKRLKDELEMADGCLSMIHDDLWKHWGRI